MIWREMTIDEKIAAIKSAWKPESSARDIAGRIGDISRNSVVGIYHRNPTELVDFPLLGASERQFRQRAITLKVNASRDYSKSEKSHEPKTSSVPIKEVADDVIDPSGVDIVDLKSNSCRWPVSDAPWRFCGCKIDRRSYCQKHYDLAYGGGSRGEQSITPRNIDRFMRRLKNG